MLTDTDLSAVRRSGLRGLCKDLEIRRYMNENSIAEVVEKEQEPSYHIHSPPSTAGVDGTGVEGMH
jgi:hypothetical protein